MIESTDHQIGRQVYAIRIPLTRSIRQKNILPLILPLYVGSTLICLRAGVKHNFDLDV